MRWTETRRIGWAGCLAACLAVFSSCGGGGNNDQGIVFRATGIFRGLASIDDTTITCTEPTISNVIVDSSYTISISTIPDFPNRFFATADPCGGYIGLQNNLSTQSFQVQEIVISYDVPGASIPIPGTSLSFGLSILPASSDATTASGQANLVYSQLLGQIVSSELMVFLNQNVNRLPARPYLMNVYFVAKGQSDTGTQYTSNEIGYTLTIED